MAKFVFELEPVLKHRLALERTQQLAVAQLQAQRAQIEDEIRSYQRQLQVEKNAMRDALGPAPAREQGVDLRAVRMQAGASLHLVALAQRAVMRLAGVHQRLEQARQKLIEATTARRAVELLRERQYEAWRREQDRRENTVLDELVVMRSAAMARGDVDREAA